jgi:polyhydroxybutyrate depolymerase
MSAASSKRMPPGGRGAGGFARLATRPLACLALWIATISCPAPALAIDKQDLTIDVAGVQREYLLATPDNAAAGPRPLVLVLHGHLGTAANALGGGIRPSPLSAWSDIADREHVLVAALQGLLGPDRHTGWHDCRLDAFENPRSDDVAFAERVVDRLVQAQRADPHRIYVMGMSNGAIMSLRLAQEMHPAPAAVAAVSGSMAANSSCKGTPRRVSVLLIGGTADPIVPFGGGTVTLGRRKSGAVSGVAASRDFWLHADGLDPAAARTTTLPHHAAADPTHATRVLYGTSPGPQVEVLTIEGGGHVEPSLRFHYGWFYSKIVGNQNQDVESAEEAWSFFKEKTAP